MTKADLVKNISDKTGMDKSDVQMIAEKFMNEVKNSLKNILKSALFSMSTPVDALRERAACNAPGERCMLAYQFDY